MDLSPMDPDTLLSFAGRLHPLLLHLPIGLWLGIAVLEFGGAMVRRAPGRATLSILTWVAAFGGAFAAGSGWLLAREGYDPKTIDVHRWLGIAAAGIGLLAACFSALQARGAFRLLLSIEFVVLMAAGHLGSEITHGKDWLFEPFEQGETGGGRSATAAATPVVPSTNPPAATGTQTAPAAPPRTEPATGPLPFEAAVQPILQRYCTQCHGEQKQKGDLALHTRAGIEKGGENGPVFVPGHPESSPLFTNLLLPVEHDDHMPPDGKKQPTAAEIDVLRTWIASGAPFTMAAEVPPTPKAPALRAPAGEPDPAGEPVGSREPEPTGESKPDAEPRSGGVPKPSGEAAPPAPPAPAPAGVETPVVPPQPPAEPRRDAPPAGNGGEPNPTPALQTALAALARRQVMVRAIADGSDGLAVDFGPIAPSTTADEVRTLLLPVARSVEDLSLSRVPVDDRLLTAVAALPRLRRLDLTATRTTPELLRPLVRAAALRELVLTGTRLDDRAADVLLQIPALASLHAADAGLGPAALSRLRARAGLDVIADVEATPHAPTSGAPATEPAAPESEPESAPTSPLSPQNADCPVCRNPVDRRFVVVHGNRAVAFCSIECPVAFWQEPARYPLPRR